MYKTKDVHIRVHTVAFVCILIPLRNICDFLCKFSSLMSMSSLYITGIQKQNTLDSSLNYAEIIRNIKFRNINCILAVSSKQI